MLLRVVLILGIIGVGLMTFTVNDTQKQVQQAGNPKNESAVMTVSKKTLHEQYFLFSSTVRSAGFACPAVIRHLYMGRDEGKYFWTVMCKNGVDYAISFGGTAPYKSRTVACQLPIIKKLNFCWKVLKS